MATDAYLALMGRASKRIPHWEHLSNPDFEYLMTGIDPWEHPRIARQKLLEQVKIDFGCGVPASDEPIPRPEDSQKGAVPDADGRLRVRWGAGTTTHWDWGADFKTIEQVIAYEPLEHLDLREAQVVENRDYSVSDEAFYAEYAKHYPSDGPAEGEVVQGLGFYNTLFMWPLLTFGWELFLELAGGHPEPLKRLLADFAVINRKVFGAFARLPVNMVVCHDDICMASGPVCSPTWLREHIYPYYEEFFGILHDGGKRVVFICDGNIDKVADDVAACGADGFVSESFTDWKAVARKHPHRLLAGEGDNRILMRNNPEEIARMVDGMVETARMCGGYVMCVGNHIPWNIPPEAVRTYFELSKERAVRDGMA